MYFFPLPPFYFFPTIKIVKYCCYNIPQLILITIITMYVQDACVEHVYREFNSLADSLANIALDDDTAMSRVGEYCVLNENWATYGRR